MLKLPDKCSKYFALERIFQLEDIASRWNNKKVTVQRYLEVISKDTYNLHDELPICDTTISKIHRSLWPERPSSNTKICGYLLNKYKYKYCIGCKTVQSIDNWHNNSAKNGGKDSYCIPCFNASVKDYRRSYVANYKAEKLNRTPLWANLKIIRDIYDCCPEGCHVDHIIPLQGELVSGLHVENNLQYLSKEENLKKSNKYIPE